MKSHLTVALIAAMLLAVPALRADVPEVKPLPVKMAESAPAPVTVADLTFTLPTSEWKAKADGTTIVITPRKGFNDVMIRPSDSKTVADAIDTIAKVIHGEVIEFKQTKATDIKVAGSAAKLVLGTGKEADDNDPSNTEVFVFTIGDKVYTACVHGEGTDAEKLRPEIAAVLDTIKAK